MVLDINRNIVYTLLILFVLLSFMQISEGIFKSGYVETEEASGGILGYVLSLLEDLPVIGILFNFFTINIPGSPDMILLLLNIINGVILVVFFVNINNLVVDYFDLDEGLLGWLF